MKQILIATVYGLFLTNTLLAQGPLSEADRQLAIEHLEQTQKQLLESTKGLSDEQLTFKASPEAWSIAECVEHLAISEGNIFGMLEMSLKTEPDPSKRAEVKMSDEQILGIITNRDQKVKTSSAFEPTGLSYEESLQNFESKRKSNIEYIKNTKDDLRNRYADLPFGKLDAFQVVLFMSAHTERHVKQIEEVKADPKFPG